MSSTLVTPLLISVPWGASAANPTYINLPVPVPDQTGLTINAASFTTGFPPNTMTPEASGGLPFFGQDLNGILWMVSAYCANFAAGAFAKYDSTLSGLISGYPLGAIVSSTGAAGGTNNLWVNLVDGNTTNPDAGGANWLPMDGVGATAVSVTTVDVTLSALQAALPYIKLTGALTGNHNVIFPVNTGQQWVVSNACSGAHTVTVKTASGTGVVVPATGAAAPTSIYCDGTNIQNTGVSTAGLAPIASPALTGTPTAPTATPATTNTTQIATTAFVQAAVTAALSLYALKASPIFSGTPTAPTPANNDNSLKLATTAFVKNVLAQSSSLLGSGFFTIGGFYIQWGKVIGGSGAPQTVGFPTAFPTACFAIVATPSPNNATINVSDPASSRTSFVLQNGAAGVNTLWVAVGH